MYTQTLPGDNLPGVFDPLYALRVSWSDWTNLALNAIGVAATIAGFGLAVWQLVRAARAAESTAGIAAGTRLLGLTTTLRSIEQDLDGAAAAGERGAALRAVRDWRDVTADLFGQLAVDPTTDPEMLNQLEVSMTVASRTKGDLMNDDVTVFAATEKMRDEMARITDTLSLVGSRMKAIDRGAADAG